MQAAIFQNVLSSLFNAIIPKTCVLCEAKLAEKSVHLCSSCRTKIKKIESPVCKKCGYPIIPEDKDILCARCLTLDYYFDRAKSLFIYEDPLKEMIIKTKYYNNLFYFPVLIDLLNEDYSLANEKYDLIIPVPLHVSRLKKRGFNQSAILAKSISKKTKIKMNFDILKRVKNTPFQSSLSYKERLENIKKSTFDLDLKKGALSSMKILLVDDVITTGITSSFCSRILKEKGNAGCVDVLSLTRTIKE